VRRERGNTDHREGIYGIRPRVLEDDMILNEKQIENNIGWLLKNGSPPVRYLTHKYLMRTAGQDETLWRDVETCREAAGIFDKQEPDGSWCAGGSWALTPSYKPQGGVDPYTPKYVTAVWVLPILGEMGFTARDGRIRKACDFILEHGYFRDPIFIDPAVPVYDSDISPCRFAQYLIALGAVDCVNDSRIEKGYDYLLNMQRDDGGWAHPKHLEERNWDRSCPWSTYHAAAALYYKKDEGCRDALVRALGFLGWHLSAKKPEDICRFFYHGHSTVRELMMLSEYKTGLNEKAVQTIIDWLMTMYQEEGYFKYNGKPISQYKQKIDGMDARVAKYRLHHLIENDWLTLHMTRICMNALA
jgi:hypothetical protein